jgi:hypothetical protein
MMIAFQPIIKANKTTNNTRVYGYFFYAVQGFDDRVGKPMHLCRHWILSYNELFEMDSLR